MNSQYQVKAMLKEIAAFLHKHDGQLFGKKFRNDIANTIKSNRKIRKSSQILKILSMEPRIFTETE